MAMGQTTESLDGRRIASTLNEAIESGRQGQGYHVGINAVSDLATKTRDESVLRDALVDAARKIFDETREIKQHQGGRTFDSIAAAHEREKILFYGLTQVLPLERAIEPRDASHYTSYGVSAFVQAFAYTTPHLSALSTDDLKREVATRTADNLSELYRHERNKRDQRAHGDFPVLDHVLPLFHQVSGVPRLRTAVEDGVFLGVNEFIGSYGKAGHDAVRSMIKTAHAPNNQHNYLPHLAKNAELALSYHLPEIAPGQNVMPAEGPQGAGARKPVKAMALTQN